MGKSYLVQLYIVSLFERSQTPRTVIYLVPSRALITQVSNDIAHVFRAKEQSSPEIITIPVGIDSSLPHQVICLMTQERVHLTLQAHPELDAELIIVDEAQAISEGSRGILLQSVSTNLLIRRSTAQIIFASPTTRNLDVYGHLSNLPNISKERSVEPAVSQNFLAVSINPQGALAIRECAIPVDHSRWVR